MERGVSRSSHSAELSSSAPCDAGARIGASARWSRRPPGCRDHGTPSGAGRRCAAAAEAEHTGLTRPSSSRIRRTVSPTRGVRQIAAARSAGGRAAAPQQSRCAAGVTRACRSCSRSVARASLPRPRGSCSSAAVSVALAQRVRYARRGERRLRPRLYHRFFYSIHVCECVLFERITHTRAAVLSRGRGGRESQTPRERLGADVSSAHECQQRHPRRSRGRARVAAAQCALEGQPAAPSRRLTVASRPTPHLDISRSTLDAALRRLHGETRPRRRCPPSQRRAPRRSAAAAAIDRRARCRGRRGRLARALIGEHLPRRRRTRQGRRLPRGSRRVDALADVLARHQRRSSTMRG